LKKSRIELEKALKLVAPALYAKDGVDELACIWFHDNDASTYDGELGLIARAHAGFDGGVKGSTILNIVSNSAAKDIELEPANGELGQIVKMKAGRSKIELPLLPVARRPKWPESLEVDNPIEITDDLLEALKLGYVACGNNESRPDFFGTTLMKVNDELQMFTSDGATATAAFCALPKDWTADRVAWPRRFCEQLVRLFDKDDGWLNITPGNVLAQREDKLWLLGRELHVTQPINYGAMFARVVPESFEKDCYPIPEGFKSALETASVLLAKQKESRIKIEAAGKELKLSGGGDAGQYSDELKIDGKQESIALRADPMLVRRILPHVDRMLLTEDVIIFGKSESDFTHVISCSRAL